MHIVDLVAVCVGAVLVLVCALVLARQRVMLRAVGSIPIALRPSGSSRWQYGVARYAGDELRWYRSLGIGTGATRVLRRPRMTVTARRAPSAQERSSLPAHVVVVTCSDGDTTVQLALSEGAFTGFVSWLESSAPRA